MILAKIDEVKELLKKIDIIVNDLVIEYENESDDEDDDDAGEPTENDEDDDEDDEE